MKLINKGDVWIIEYDRASFPIGRIRNNRLYLDSPSRHRQSQSYGIDEFTLNNIEMDYHYISISERHHEWITSREFWRAHSKVYDLNNGRKELFLADQLFGLDKAKLYSKYMSVRVQEMIKFDVFDISQKAKDWGDQAFMDWEKAIDIEEQYKQSLKYKRKVEL